MSFRSYLPCLDDVQFIPYNHEVLPKEILATRLYDGYEFKLTLIENIQKYLIFCNNTTVLFSDIDEIPKGQRFDFIRLIASDLLDHEVDILDIQNRTIYGVLHISKIHRFVNPQVIYYGITNTNIKEALQFFNHYGLNQPHVEIVHDVQKFITRIRGNDIELEQAGALLHTQDKIYKIVNNEYALLEFIQNNIQDEQSKKDVQKYIKENRLPRPQDFYLAVLDEARYLVQKYGRVANLSRDNFGQLISIILFNLNNKKQFQVSQISELIDTPWDKYQPQVSRIPIEIQRNKTVYVLVFYGISGMGSTTLIKQLKLQTLDSLDVDFTQYADNTVLAVDFNQYDPSFLDKLKGKVKRIVVHPPQQKFEDIDYRLPFNINFILTTLKRSAKNIDDLAIAVQYITKLEDIQFDKLDCEIRIEFPFVEPSDDQVSKTVMNLFLDVYDESIDKRCTNKKLLNQFLKSIEVGDNYPQNYAQEVNSIRAVFPKQVVAAKENYDLPVVQKQPKVVKPKAAEKYNPLYLPHSLVINVKNRFQERDKINRFIRDALNFSIGQVPKDTELKQIEQEFQSQTLNNGPDVFSLEKKLSLKLLEINGDESINYIELGLRQLPYFRDFIPNFQCDLSFHTVLISNGLITLLTQPQLPCQNPYPHVTVYTRNLRSKDATELILQAIQSDAVLKQNFKEGKLYKPEKNQLSQASVNIRGKVTKAYLVTLTEGFKLEGQSSDEQ